MGGLTSTNTHDRSLHHSIQGEEDSEADSDADSEADGSPDAEGEVVGDRESGSGNGDSQGVWRPHCPASTTAAQCAGTIDTSCLVLHSPMAQAIKGCK